MTDVRAVRFSRVLYDPAAIDEALVVFAEHGEFASRSVGQYTEIEVAPRFPETADELVGELENYILALTIEKRRAASGIDPRPDALGDSPDLVD